MLTLLVYVVLSLFPTALVCIIAGAFLSGWPLLLVGLVAFWLSFIGVCACGVADGIDE